VDRAVGAGDHGGQRCADDRHYPDQVEAALAGDPEVVDVEDRELGASAGEQLRGIAGFPRLLDPQVDAGVLVETLGGGDVDAAVDRVRGEIEHNARAFRHARFRAIPATAGHAGECEDGRQQRDSPSHSASNLIH
jgi:hypothetical protein